MSEFTPFTPNKIIPVTDTSKNTTDNTTVILLFLPIPFFIAPLYHPQWLRNTLYYMGIFFQQFFISLLWRVFFS